ncbi:hypothetical protein BS47DRAFT_1312253 [Hydnum rufescens UP504]|uniref:Uncharacterized protein n=1 Tax=Hydnum rufescens UP504 TaxID=1448309 RepID=A0A9P6BA12_9AGAM|nr:hypothetical protein BS47DRAFT_1312253 [Hydnum rufescens UP504]
MASNKRKSYETWTSGPPSGSPSTAYGNSPNALTTPAAKRARTTTNTASDLPVEKRLARFKPKCPQATLDRVERVMQQRFFLVDRERQDQALSERFKILGSTGNVYDVVIDKLPVCTCPDASKGNHCKHLLFVFLKVLDVPITSSLYYQKALLSTELEEIFSHAPKNPTILASQRVREAYAVATGSPSKPSSSQAPPPESKHRSPNGDDCAVCYEAMEGDVALLETILVWCETCHNAVHKECFGQWSNTAKATGSRLTCVYCRAPWPVSKAAGPSTSGGVTISEDGYVNLASIAGISTERDTSTYYNAYRRGFSSYYKGRSHNY